MNYKWLFSGEDENGDNVSLGENEREFIGTSAEANTRAEELANAWETKTGGLVLRLELERRGKVEREAHNEVAKLTPMNKQ